jgi:DNA-binding IclR family transcriptional regulator
MKQLPSRPNSVEKALEIILAFRSDQPSWGVRELSAHLGFSPATVQRTLQTLKSYQFVVQDTETRQYRLGNVYFRLLDVLQSTHPVTRASLPFMRELLSTTQETVHLNVIDGTERICIDNMESPQYLKASMPIGNRSPLYAGASSKCLLAFSAPEFIDHYLETVNLVPLTEQTIRLTQHLKEEIKLIRVQGFALSLGERTPGLGSLSAPVLDHNGTILAALSLAVPELRFKDKRHRQRCLESLMDVSHRLSLAMGYALQDPQEPL